MLAQGRGIEPAPEFIGKVAYILPFILPLNEV